MRVTREIELPCPPEEAWEILTDWERQADWMLDADGVVVRSAHRAGRGVVIEVRTRLFGIPAFRETIEVIGWGEPWRMVIRHGPPLRGTGTWDLSPVPGGTRLVWREDVRLNVPILGDAAAFLYGPLLRWLMGMALERLRRSVVGRGPRR